VFAGTSRVNRVAETAETRAPSHNGSSRNGAHYESKSQENKSVTLGPEKELSTAGCKIHSNQRTPEKITLPSKPRTPQRSTPIRISSAAAQSWGRAVEKLRNHQTDLQQRADKAKRESITVKFDQPWDEFPAARHESGRTANAPDNLRAKQQDARSSASGSRHDRSAQRTVAADCEALRGFDELWDGVSRAKPPEVSSTPSLARLPVSPSPVIIEPNDTRSVLSQSSVSKSKLQKLFNSLRDALS